MSNESISVKDQFNIWKAESERVFGESKQGIIALMEPIQKTIKDECIDNIPANFGKFLYSCLGDRVVGQTNSVVNRAWLNSEKGKRMVELATGKNCTIEEYLEKHDYRKSWDDKKVFNQTQAFLSAGRKFGVTYVTGCGDRSHTIYFEEGSIFRYLMQEHVDCILNKEKKKCTQAFLDYRNEFLGELKTLSAEVLTIGVPVKIAKVVSLTTQAQFNRYEQRESNLSATVIQDITEDVVELATITMPMFDVWDGAGSLASHSAKGTSDLNIAFSIQFGSMKGTKVSRRSPNHKQVTVYGNVDVSVDQLAQTVDVIDSGSDKHVLGIHDTNGLPDFCCVVNNIDQHVERYYANECVTNPDGLVINMVDLVAHPNVQGAIQKRLEFYKTWSTKLQDLKHSFAGLYFLHSD